MAFTNTGWQVFSNSSANGQVFGSVAGQLGTSAAFGVDDTDTGKFKIQVLPVDGAVPTGTVQMTIDPSTNGNVTINPNGVGATVLTTDLNMPQTISNKVGVINFASVPYFHVTGPGPTNAFVGANTGNFTLTGTSNCILGNSSAAALTSGFLNSAVGTNTLLLATSAFENVAMGNAALGSLLTGSFNVGLGYRAGFDYNNAESSNVCIANMGTPGESHVMRLGTNGGGNGQQTICYIDPPTTINNGSLNVISGNVNIPTTTASIGQYQINGVAVLQTIGTGNVFVGNQAGNLTLTGTYNVAVGHITAHSFTSGNYNQCIGVNAGNSITTGSQHVAVGAGALYTITGGTIGCTAVGYQSLYYATGDANVGIGTYSLLNLTNGTENIGIGYQAGSSYTSSESNNICIGYQVTGTNAESNVTRIGNSSVTKTVLQGNVTGATFTATGDSGGTASTTAVSNVTNTTQGAGINVVKSTGAGANNNTGYLKFYVGTTAVYVPYWATP